MGVLGFGLASRARLTLPAGGCQTDRLLAWAEPFGDERVWAIESAAGLGRLLAQQLVAAGEQVVDVPPTLAARVRLLSPVKASKNDPNDALSTAIAGLRHCGLRRVDRDDHTAVLRLLGDRHHELTALRTQAACRVHALVRELTAGGARCGSVLLMGVNCSSGSRSMISSLASVDGSRSNTSMTSLASTTSSSPSSSASPTQSPPRVRRSPSCTVSGR